MSGAAGALSARLPVGLWLRWFPPTTAFGAGPSPGGRALLRLGLLLFPKSDLINGATDI